MDDDVPKTKPFGKQNRTPVSRCIITMRLESFLFIISWEGGDFFLLDMVYDRERSISISTSGFGGPPNERVECSSFKQRWWWWL